jgi:hypothetical protein
MSRMYGIEPPASFLASQCDSLCHPTVISVGANPELVRLRNLVLQEAGFNVIFTLDEQEALARIEARRVWCSADVLFAREVSQEEAS